MINLYFRKNVLLLLVLGFVSGTPFLLTLSTLSFWLSENQVSKSLIGLFILVSLPYSFKFLWAPLLDFYTPPLLGKILGSKRSWGLLAQVFLMISIIALGHSDPSQNLMQTAFWAFLVSFFSATQDTIIDTLRIELLKADEVGPGAAMETIGFRLGMMLSGAGALYLAATMTWSMSYTLLSLTVLVGMLVMTMIDEPRKTARLRRDYSSLVRIYVNTLSVLYRKPYFLHLIAFIFCFKIGDTVLNAMISPFLCDLGFTKVEFANVSKFFGISLMVCGGIAGGAIINQIGLWQSIIFCAVLQAISCLLFIIQSIVGHNITILFITVGIESLTSGLTATAFIALLSSFCYAPFSASHFTLLYSLGSLSRVLISSASGFTAEHFGWNTLFALAALSVMPTLYFIYAIKNLSPFEKGIRHEKQHSSI